MLLDGGPFHVSQQRKVGLAGVLLPANGSDQTCIVLSGPVRLLSLVA